ncbi:hypothetical protein LSTR_LSTR009503 [Laodelphax striatellus]|uniref:Uncharacterized protein n=1 Tax=Laodelphax striatellus TaxID=195883 RepID=A0A482WF63_LAOST|nr:hypothetical protein LSTR_LSTR009503 [Laodelphax striatellus]
MFKKKTDLAPWPKPPTNDQVLEDVNSAPKDDPVFEEESTTKSASAYRNESDAAYERLKGFLIVNKSLEKVMCDLEDRNNCLQGYSTDLQKMVEDIRQTAFEALK